MADCVRPAQVAQLLLMQDLFQTGSHWLSHFCKFHHHLSHHRHFAPTMLDAFDGTVVDTFCMILLPLRLATLLVSANGVNAASYLAFGVIYSNWLVLIHAEFAHPWDGLFECIGLGTSAYHQQHHRKPSINLAHLFNFNSVFKLVRQFFSAK